MSVKELDWRTDRDSILSTCPQPLDYVIATGIGRHGTDFLSY